MFLNIDIYFSIYIDICINSVIINLFIIKKSSYKRVLINNYLSVKLKGF